MGIVSPLGDGAATITATVNGASTTITVTVKNANTPRPVTFERDIQPILTRSGCNAGACHGKARGQNGFQLSLLAFDPDFDFNAITTEARGRRVFPANPAFSLLLRKPSRPGAARRREEARPRARSAYRTLAPLDRDRHAAHAGRRAEAAEDHGLPRQPADDLQGEVSNSRSPRTTPTAPPAT